MKTLQAEQPCIALLVNTDKVVYIVVCIDQQCLSLLVIYKYSLLPLVPAFIKVARILTWDPPTACLFRLLLLHVEEFHWYLKISGYLWDQQIQKYHLLANRISGKARLHSCKIPWMFVCWRLTGLTYGAEDHLQVTSDPDSDNMGMSNVLWCAGLWTWRYESVQTVSERMELKKDLRKPFTLILTPSCVFNHIWSC